MECTLSGSSRVIEPRRASSSAHVGPETGLCLPQSVFISSAFLLLPSLLTMMMSKSENLLRTINWCVNLTEEIINQLFINLLIAEAIAQPSQKDNGMQVYRNGRDSAAIGRATLSMLIPILATEFSSRKRNSNSPWRLLSMVM